MPIRLRTLAPGQESCSLDVAQAHLDGLSRRQVSEILSVGPQRVRQLEQRGAVKQRTVHDALRRIEAIAADLPDGVELTVEPRRPPPGVTHSAILVLTFSEAEVADAAKRLGIQRRPRKDPKCTADESKIQSGPRRSEPVK